ncbi:MAG: 23S rRNA (guanosine(2251)-2'-O)-methyltransferase RlmB [Anaerolineales bacterium]
MSGGLPGRELIVGRRPVLEVLRAARRVVHRLLLEEGKHGSEAEEILRAAERTGVRVERPPRETFGEMGGRHGGVGLEVDSYPYVELDEIVKQITSAPRPALVLVLDVIQDPQNLGSLLRTAEAVGVDGVLLPARRGAEITPTVVSVSSGASEHLRIARGNLVQALERLKAIEVWGVGLDSAADLPSLRSIDLRLPLALVVGSEGEGMRRLVRESCDWVVRLPVHGAVDSLNAAVAGSIALYAAWEARTGGEPEAEGPWTGLARVDRL